MHPRDRQAAAAAAAGTSAHASFPYPPPPPMPPMPPNPMAYFPGVNITVSPFGFSQVRVSREHLSYFVSFHTWTAQKV